MAKIIEAEQKVTAAPPHPEVPTKTRFLWGIGGFTDMAMYNGINSLTQQVWVNARGIDPVFFGVAASLPNFLGFVTDPLIGHLSDNTRSRWGRRRPWMLAGLLIAALISIFMWFPPAFPALAKGTPWGQALAAQWPALLFLLGMLVAFFTVGYAFFSITHTAMGYEMTTNYNERTHLFKWRMMAAAACGFIAPWSLKFCMLLEGGQAEVLKGAQGVQTFCFIIAGIFLVTGLCPVLFCQENIAAHKDEKKVPFLKAVRLTLRNRPFWLLVISNFITKFGMCVTGIFFGYLFLYHLSQGSMSDGATYLPVFSNAINITSFLALGPIAVLTDRIGKKAALIGCLILSTLAYASIWFTMSNDPAGYLSIPLPWGPAGNSLPVQWPCLITALLVGAFTNTMPMIKNSMLADICDLDELNSGHRREAFYGAVFVTTDKLAMATSLFLQGVLLKASGFDAALSTQSAETVRYWLQALVITQPLGFLVGIIAILYYPLTHVRSLQIRTELESRKAKRSQLT